MLVPKEVLCPISGKCIVVMTEKSSDIAERFAKASKIQKRLGINLASYGNAKRKPQHKAHSPLLHRRRNRVITENMRNKEIKVLTERNINAIIS